MWSSGPTHVATHQASATPITGTYIRMMCKFAACTRVFYSVNLDMHVRDVRTCKCACVCIHAYVRMCGCMCLMCSVRVCA